MHSSGLPKSSTSPLPKWSEIYFEAVSETDEHESLVKLEFAANALDDRMGELRRCIPHPPQELEDLESALTYVRLLLLASSQIGRSSSVDKRVNSAGDPDGQIRRLSRTIEPRCDMSR